MRRVFLVCVALQSAACGGEQSKRAEGGGAGSSGAPGTGGASACPPGLTGAPTLGGTATRVAGVPIPDAFNMNDGEFGNVEGPVWIDGALYVSEMSSDSYDSQNTDVKRARILKVTPGGAVSVEVSDSGSNGLAVDRNGNLVMAVHKDGTIKRIARPGGTTTTLAEGYMGARFDSPNDLAIHSSGTIYFSDPDYQAPRPRPQAQTRVYRLPVGGTVEPIPSAASPDSFVTPNGVTLSLAEDYLYVAAATGRRYPVRPDGTLGAGEDFPPASRGDGMAIDCAGNLYVARTGGADVIVYSPAGAMLGRLSVPDVQAVTNVAFGGEDHQTLYVTGLGNRKGLFQIPLTIPGKPY